MQDRHRPESRKQRKKRRGWTLGSWLMALITLAVIASIATVLPRLTQRQDVSAALVDTVEAWASQTARPEATRRAATVTAAPTARPAPAVTAVPSTSQGGTLTLTFGGTVALETNVRQSGYYQDTGLYDFSDILLPAQETLQGDISLVSLENLVVPGAKLSKLVAPAPVMRMLQRAGVRQLALGFGRCFEQGAAGVSSTLAAAREEGLTPFGLYDSEADAAPESSVQTIGGLRVALLHGTASLTTASSKALRRDGRPDLVPTDDSLPERIRAAKDAGAQFVVVTVHWGSEGKTAPTKAQRTLAQKLAEAGADIIIGYGSRRVQTAEWLFSPKPDGATRQTLCCYCLGCMLSDARESGAVASAVVRTQVSFDPAGNVAMSQPVYTPMYLWQYKQDGATNYRLIPADQAAPDGMEQKQAQAMQTALKNVRKALEGSALVQGH